MYFWRISYWLECKKSKMRNEQQLHFFNVYPQELRISFFVSLTFNIAFYLYFFLLLLVIHIIILRFFSLKCNIEFCDVLFDTVDRIIRPIFHKIWKGQKIHFHGDNMIIWDDFEGVLVIFEPSKCQHRKKIMCSWATKVEKK